jgi:NADH:ubiquinone oxidoreductase subunit 6 (subunit J)
MANVSERLPGLVQEWSWWLSGQAMPPNRFGFADCPCSDDYVGSAFTGILMNGGHAAVSLVFLFIIVASPIVLGLTKRIGSRTTRIVILTWSSMVAWSFGVALLESHWFGKEWRSQAIQQIPAQVLFNAIFLLLLPAALISFLKSCMNALQKHVVKRRKA